MKLTPLNITLACVLVWFISEWNLDGGQLFSLGWMALLVILLALLDLGFRLLFRDLKKLWLVQIGFIVVVSILVVLLKLM